MSDYCSSCGSEVSQLYRCATTGRLICELCVRRKEQGHPVKLLQELAYIMGELSAQNEVSGEKLLAAEWRLLLPAFRPRIATALEFFTMGYNDWMIAHAEN